MNLLRTLILCGVAMAALAAEDAKSIALTVNAGVTLHSIDAKAYAALCDDTLYFADLEQRAELGLNTDFTARFPGNWRVQDNVLAQNAAAGAADMTFGETNSGDVIFGAEVRRTEGSGGIVLHLRQRGGWRYSLKFGVPGSKAVVLEREDGSGIKTLGEADAPVLTSEKAFSIKLVRKESHVAVFIDSDPALDAKDDSGLKADADFGLQGFGTRECKAEFRSVYVKSGDDKKMLFYTLPSPLPNWELSGAAHAGLYPKKPLSGRPGFRIEGFEHAMTISQRLFGARKDDTLVGSVWIRGDTTAPVFIKLVDENRAMLAVKKYPAPKPEWKEYPIALTPSRDADKFTFEIMGSDDVSFSHLSLKPISMVARDWRRALRLGVELIAAERRGTMETRTHSDAMQFFRAFILNGVLANSEKSAAFFSAEEVVVKLWREHFAPNRLAVEGDAGGVDVVAAASETGDEVVLKAVNPGSAAVEIAIELKGKFDPHTAALKLIAPEKFDATNSYEHPNEVRASDGTCKLDGRVLRFILPAHSVGAVRVKP